MPYRPLKHLGGQVGKPWFYAGLLLIWTPLMGGLVGFRPYSKGVLALAGLGLWALSPIVAQVS